MYIKKAFFLNCGPTKNLDIGFQFNEDDTPKPVLLVGENGSGKTNILSFVTDALILIADQRYQDVSLRNQFQDKMYHRQFGGDTITVNSDFELSIIKFIDDQNSISYLSKARNVDDKTIEQHLYEFRKDVDWNEHQFFKGIYPPPDSTNLKIIENIFLNGCYLSFPVDRAEIPFWSTQNIYNGKSKFLVQDNNSLDKPIVVQSSLNDLKPWLIDVLNDILMNFYSCKMNGIDFDDSNQTQYDNFNVLIRKILKNDSFILWKDKRHKKNGNLFIGDEKYNVILPSLDALSSGQSTLLSIFSTILRYSDYKADQSENKDDQFDMKEMKGIVLIDEVDAHLHVDLLYSVLPELIKLFPKIQFIMTAHNPLFVLGMNNMFGEDGYTLLELPEGKRITAERYKEFENAFKYVKDTKAFEGELRKIIEGIDAKNKSCILCEGKTDEDYWNTAAQIFGYEELLNKTIIKCVGTNDGNHSRDNGKSALDKAYKFLEIHKEIFKNKIIFLYDCDVKKPGIFNKKNDFLNQYFVDQNPKNTRFTKGVENLFPVEAFENYCPPKYFNSDRVDPYYNKKDMCNELCKNKDPNVFANFEPILKELQNILLET